MSKPKLTTSLPLSMPEVRELSFEKLTTCVRWKLGHHEQQQFLYHDALPIPESNSIPDEVLLARMMQFVNHSASVGGYNMRRSLPGIAIDNYNAMTRLFMPDCNHSLFPEMDSQSLLLEMKKRTEKIDGEEENEIAVNDLATLTTKELRAQLLDILQVSYSQYFEYVSLSEIVRVSLMSQLLTSRMQLRQTCMQATLKNLDDECRRRRWAQEQTLADEILLNQKNNP